MPSSSLSTSAPKTDRSTSTVAPSSSADATAPTKVGASLTGVISSVAVVDVDRSPSVTSKLITISVSSFRAGVKLHVPSKLSTRVPNEAASRDTFKTDNVSSSTSVAFANKSASVMRKPGSAGAGVSSSVLPRSTGPEISGASFEPSMVIVTVLVEDAPPLSITV